MATVIQAAHVIFDASDDLCRLALHRHECAPVDDEILSKVAEISRALDEIRDNIAEGIE